MQVGFIGLGIMGSLQAMNLAKAGYELTVFNRTREKADAWVAENGGTAVDSPQAVAEASDVVITMVVDGAQVEDMVDQALPGAREHTLFIDMSTIAPGTARALDERLREAGHAFVDAPVTGLLAQGADRHADDHVRRRRGRHRACSPAVRGHGREDRRLRGSRPGPGGESDLAGDHGCQLRDIGPRAGAGAPSRRQRRQAARDDGRRLRRTRRCVR